MRWMFASEARGDLKKGTARRWLAHTPDTGILPERVHRIKRAAESRRRRRGKRMSAEG